MRHYTCDLCDQRLPDGQPRYVASLRIRAAVPPAALTDDDLNDDAVAELARLMDDIEQGRVAENLLPPASVCHRYDLCGDCRARLLREPLGRESARPLRFSPN